MFLSTTVSDGEQEVCLAGEDSDSTKTWNSGGLKSIRSVRTIGLAILCVCAFSAVGYRMLDKSSAMTPTKVPVGKPVFLERETFPSCEMYFAVGKDCQKKNLWECDEDDGTQAFNCCCNGGYGDYSGTTGELVWKDYGDHPEMCLDLSMPYVGTGKAFDSSVLQLGECAVGDGHPGNPYKMFQYPKEGEGKIKWATHPDKCLGASGGYPGADVKLFNCGDKKWGESGEWDVPVGNRATKPHQIRWKPDPGMCLNVAGGRAAGGTKVQLFNCTKGWSSQKFYVKRPETAKNDEHPSLFCISLMMSFGYEISMMKNQLNKGVGIYDCNEAAVYSNVSITLSRKGDDEVKTDVMEGSLAVDFGGKWHTALNTPVFIRFWKKVLSDPRAKRNAWTVKIDPDAVFVPSRLREVLLHKWPDTKGDAKSPVYLNNCYLGMHGPIEVLSRDALTLYGKKGKHCQDKDNNVSKIQQEDFYFRKCWEYVGVKKQNVYNILFENKYACNERPVTRDGRHPCFSRQISIHPFKTVKGYMSCYHRAVSQYFSEPMNIYSEPPGHDNYHHS